MSWQDWCKNIQACGCVAGGIYDHNGNPWAEFGMNDTYSLTPADIKNARQCIVSKDPCKAPVKIGGSKQMAVKADEGGFIAKLTSQMSIVVIDCAQCVVVGIGGQGSEPRNFCDPISKIADQLKAAGY